ncbi:MAG: hypothetical protein M1591_06885 [Deltaproteobacteria bacterium]|nr:hypothetical protein [Deltaproteobacteria bacterium]
MDSFWRRIRWTAVAGLVMFCMVCAGVPAPASADNRGEKIAAAEQSGSAAGAAPVQAAHPVDSCAGPTALLSVLDRPTISDSVCSAKKNKVIVELGYDYQFETGNDAGTLQTLPQPEVRYGTGGNIELKLFPPNYLIRTMQTAGRTAFAGGFGDAGVGAKYEFGYGEKWGVAADTAVTFASGSKDFTGHSTGAIVNGIFAYNVNKDIGIGLQIGLFHLFSPIESDQQTTLNPILVVSDQLNGVTDKLQLYAECYNTIDLLHGTGIVSFADAGVQYLVFGNVELDVEAGHNLTDLPSNNTTYLGFGTGLEF